MTTTPSSHDAALSTLGKVLNSLDPVQHLGLAVVTLTKYADDRTPANLKPLLLSIADLTDGTTPGKLEHLASVLEVSPELRAGVRLYASELERLDPRRASFWRALVDLAEVVG